MARYGYPDPCAPGYKKPTSIEDCLSQARIMAKKTFGRGALGPVKRIVTYPDQDKYVKEAIIQALEEEGAEKVDFFNDHELGGKELVSRSVENGWAEAERMAKALPGRAELPHLRETGEGLRKLLDKHPEYTGVFMGQGGRPHVMLALGQHGAIFGAVVPVFPHAEHVETIEKGLSMAKVLGGSRALIMKGHGAVIAESSVEGAFLASCHLEENARLFVEASILGNPIPLSEDQLKRAKGDTFTSRSIEKGWSYFLKKGRKAAIFWD